jgi:hypothetical protein
MRPRSWRARFDEEERRGRPSQERNHRAFLEHTSAAASPQTGFPSATKNHQATIATGFRCAAWLNRGRDP